MTTSRLDRGREAFRRNAWADACAHLAAADRQRPLDPEDLQRLATAAYLTGRIAESADIWARAHHELLGRGEVERAARCAFWLAFGLLNHGERARGGGWIARARRLLDEARRDCVERGYLLLPVGLGSIAEGDLQRAHATFSEAAGIGDRFGDPDLAALARHSRGRVLIRMGKIREGVALLDEAMVAVETDEVSPLVVGEVYCSVIEGCMEIFDLRRAQEWTSRLTAWCESQPDLVPYSGQCLVRRAEILQLRGVWPDALEQAERACERFSQGPDQPAMGAAFYQRAELHRLRGEFEDAEAAYREAARYGRAPQPGLAQLRLAQGRIEAAASGIRLAVDEAKSRGTRCRLLSAHVEIMLAAGDVEAAHVASEELSRIAGDLDAAFLHAAAMHARGAVLLGQEDARGALPLLRRAWTSWRDLDVPYEAARVRVLLGLACRALEDGDAAEMELDAARWVFEQLGAGPDVNRVEGLFEAREPKAAGGLTPREMQVLRLVAAGRTNREAAAALFISERTVERHVSNIFTKLDVSSRAAATAYAYEHQLL